MSYWRCQIESISLDIYTLKLDFAVLLYGRWRRIATGRSSECSLSFHLPYTQINLNYFNDTETFFFLTIESRGKVHKDNKVDSVGSTTLPYTWKDACHPGFEQKSKKWKRKSNKEGKLSSMNLNLTLLPMCGEV